MSIILAISWLSEVWIEILLLMVKIEMNEELDGPAVSALGVRSRKLSTGLNGQS
jgi:hypothetical protein